MARRFGKTIEQMKAFKKRKTCKPMCFSVKWPDRFHRPVEYFFEEVCSVCLVHKYPSFHAPCGHVALCGLCAKNLHFSSISDKKCPTCPICRHNTQYFKIVKAWI
jgi:hypothetical protein